MLITVCLTYALSVAFAMHWGTNPSVSDTRMLADPPVIYMYPKADPAATFAFTYTDDKNQVDFYANVTAEGYKAVYVYAGDVETYCRGVAGSSPETECIWSGSEQNSWVYYTSYAQDTAAKYAEAGFQVFLNFDGRINQKGSPGYVADFSLMTTPELQGMATATAYG